MDATTQFLPRASTGVVGLDDVLGGGVARNRLHLLEGSPGTGKTTIALQFLMAGADAGESGIYVSLAETEQELRAGARSHGWIISETIEVYELVTPESVLDPDQHQSLLYSSDLELGETIQRIFEAIERLKPKRVVIDSLSEIRLLAQSSLRVWGMRRTTSVDRPRTRARTPATPRPLTAASRRMARRPTERAQSWMRAQA